MASFKDSRFCRYLAFFVILLIYHLFGNLSYIVGAQKTNERYVQTKVAGFTDPNTKHLYRVISYNVKTMAANSTFRSVIQVSRLKLNDTNLRMPVSRPEYIQTIKFHPILVDFDLHCSPNYCFMVTVTSKSKRNVELYAWQRTQFDSLSRRDSFARPNAVRLFMIDDEFYIVVAQEQLHLSQHRLTHESDEPTRFIGCAILKFTKGNEHKMRYHQFIRLPFNPKYVNYFTSVNALPKGPGNDSHQTESYFIVFSKEPNLFESRTSQAHTFVWSPLNGYFWPFKLPRGVTVQNSPKPVSSGYQVQFPQEVARDNLTSQTLDYTEPTETCFHQLQRLLSDRDLRSRHLIVASQNVWRQQNEKMINSPSRLTNISSQVIVHGNVTVRGSMIGSPQISLLGGNHLPPQMPAQPVLATNVISRLMKSVSPLSLDHKIRQAQYKLHYIREKLVKAVYAHLPNISLSLFSSQIHLFGNIQAKEVIFRGVSNSDILLNGIPFKHLEHELVSLSGSQIITPHVQFKGRVVADMLEIHGVINDRYRLQDAIDISSRFPQILEMPSSNEQLEFHSISTPEVKLIPNATINGVLLNDFITQDNKTQVIYGQKVFKRLSMDRLDLANRGVPLNGFNLDMILKSAIHLRDPTNVRRVLHGNHINFQRPILANKLLINNLINQHINVSLLIQDSVKTIDTDVQQISGFKDYFGGLKINRLNTRGTLNGIQVSNVFNLNPITPDLTRRKTGQSIIGKFKFNSYVSIRGNLLAHLVNGIDISSRAVRRAPAGQLSVPQLVQGHKMLHRPLRVIDNVTLLDRPQIGQLKSSNISATYPYINGLDLRQISAGLARQMQQPSIVFIDNLEIDGNVDLPTYANSTFQSRTNLGNSSYCPLDAVRFKLILAGSEDQVIDIPIRINTFRARVALMDPGALNGFSLPDDFVLRISKNLEPVYGVKNFQHLVIAPSSLMTNENFTELQRIRLDRGASVNSLKLSELLAFVQLESRHNSTGEQLFNSIDVHGNVYANRINGHTWPEDILLQSLGTVSGPPESPYVHNRIYSPLVFLNSSLLEVKGQLVLRGPIKLHGRMNGVNLTDFSFQSATYGDKDLFYNGRPFHNKIFLGGFTVHGELRSQGKIDGVNIDELKHRVVTIGPGGKRIPITGSKMFMSDTVAQRSVSLFYINDLPVNKYLDRIRFQSDGQTIRILGKKIITGALRINRNLFVDGLINGVDYARLRSQAISLSQSPDQLQINKSVIVEGDVFMDNLEIDERNGTIDGIKLSNLVPVGSGVIPAQSTGRSTAGEGAMNIIEAQARAMVSPTNELALRQPISIHYERGQPSGRQLSYSTRQSRDVHTTDPLNHLRTQLFPLNLVSFSSHSDLVIGFIDATYQSLEGYQLPFSGPLHSDHLTDDLRSFVVLDQIDFSYNPVTYHLSAVVSRNPGGRNITSVQSSIGGRPHELLSLLPVEHPNSAIFLTDVQNHALFLLVSQDYTIDRNRGFICPASNILPHDAYSRSIETGRVDGNIHVYLFHVLQNSSLLRSAYFDLYQSVDLPQVDDFAKFYYHGSTYVVAASRATQRIYLLILRGFSGFQLVSHVDAPMLDHIEVVFASDERPVIVIHYTSGSYKIMESIVI